MDIDDYQTVIDNEKKISDALASIEIWKERCRWDGKMIMMKSLIKDAYKEIAEVSKILEEYYKRNHDRLVIEDQFDV
ncbi:TPA: hypothetical protein EYO57_05430 [Candidatus Poribacteria bacterium]|nr:hypothetical protein [Candidatus Poribacteria bacterium]